MGDRAVASTQGAPGETFRELWVAAEELEDPNDAIIGRIEVVAEYRPQ